MPKSSIVKLLDLPFYTEGPAMDTDGNFYFTALTGGFIGKIDRHSTYTAWSNGTCPNGQIILKSGAHWFCDSREAGIARYDPDGKFAGFLVKDSCAGVAVHSPNDLTVDSGGNLYFTDSIRKDGKVFFKGANGREAVLVEGIDYANGLVLSANEQKLYVAESYQNRILHIALAEPGIALGAPQLFAALPGHVSGNIISSLPDGLALDGEGNLWVAHYGMQAIQVLSEQGELLFTLDTGLPLTSNLHFVEDTPSIKKLLVTGGYGEPGPGAVLLITVEI